MPLSLGTRLGPYEITAALGAGGMGEVYRARDTRLGRDVAIKALPGDVASDPERRARFEREARAVAALDHPHICGIYDVGEASGTHYLVMPLIEGQTLAARLEKGALPITEALKIAGEIADALDKAHRQGIVHRDLKPANVMLTKSGVKLLDFGLAKLRPVAGAVALSDAKSATTTAGTAEGTILGTIHYMAPEQVEGKEADHRADIWALGVVLYEMVTGERPFPGETAASVMGAILKDTPRAVSSRQVLSPVHLDRIVAACLEKDPEQRWQSCRDVSRELSWLDPVAHATGGRPIAAPSGPRWLPWTVTVAATVAALGMLPGWLTTRRPAPPSTLQLSLLPPPQTTFSSPPASVVSPQLALSPDGRQLAVVAEARGGRPMLWIRALDGTDARVLRGTEDATYPFWSPDSRAVGFFAQGKLKTVDVGGGVPRTLADAALDSRGGTWGASGVILFAPERGGLLQIPAAGGTATPATTLDEARQDSTHRFPSFLPDGRHFLYSVRTRKSGEEGLGVAVGSLDSPETRVVISRTAWGAHYAEPGYILFLRAGTLMAQPFNRETFVASGDPVAIAQDVGATTTGYSSFSAASTGMLVHARHLNAPGRLRWFTRDGVPGDGLWDEGEYLDLALAPDEKTVAVSRVGDAGLTSADLWLLDLVRGVPTRFTTHPMNDASPVWAPDGTRLVFRSNREGYTQIYERRSTGTDAERTALDTGTSVIPTDWSADGRTVIYTSTTSPTGYEIWSWPAGSDQAPQRIVRTGLNATHGRLSPDGRWLAYASDESGELQVWVQPLPATGEKRQISPDGGSEPQWRRDGAELFYLSSHGQLMSVAMPVGNAFAAGAPRRLFSVDVPLAGNPFRSNYAVTKDGQRFLINTRSSAAPASISVVTNWTTLLGTTSAP